MEVYEIIRRSDGVLRFFVSFSDAGMFSMCFCLISSVFEVFMIIVFFSGA